jgi:DNA-binding PadR family transcriptional regulator
VKPKYCFCVSQGSHIFGFAEEITTGPKQMKWLSRKEEFVLLAILQLRKNAYGVTLKDYLARLTGKHWSIGAIYDVLDRLARKKLVVVRTGAPLAERGGKARQYYGVTCRGHEALEEVRSIHSDMWADLPEPATE